MISSGLATAEVSAVVTSDHKLIAVAQLGDEKAFSALFEQNKDAVYAFALRTIGSREDAEDIVQETFCRAWRSLASFRGDSRLLTWLFKIAANLCVDHMRSSRRRAWTATEASIDPEAFEASRSSEPESFAKQAVKDALNILPPSHKMLVILCDIQGFTCEEAAKIVGCSSISVRVRLSRARKKLRTLLSDVLEGVY